MSPSPKNNPPLCVSVLAWLLILGGVWDMVLLTFNYIGFREVYHWPEQMFLIRYVSSWLQSIASLAIGVGFLYGNRAWRKIAIVFAVFSIATLPWEHHYPAIVAHCQRLDESLGGMFASRRDLSQISFARLSVPILIMNYVVDIIFWGSILYYLSLPSAKKYFGIPAERS